MKFLLFISLLLGALISYAQKYNFQNFEKEEVQAKYVYDFAQDGKGVLYAASSKGLLIYDGVSFNLLDKYDGLKDNFVSKVYADKKDNIWLSYYEGGTSKLIPKVKGFSFQYFKTEPIVSIFEDDSKINLIDVDSKIGRYNKEEKEFDFRVNELLDGKLINQITLKNGNKIYQTLDGIYIDQNQRLSVIPETEFEYIKILKQNKVSNTFAYELNGFVTMFRYEDKVEKLSTLDLKKIGINTKVTNFVFGETKIIISTLGQGVFEINFHDKELKSYNYINYNKENGMLSNFVQSLFLDNDDALWIGYYGDGISVLSDTRTLWYDKTSGLANDNVGCVTNYNGDLAVGTDKGFSIIEVNKIVNYNLDNGFYNDKVKVLRSYENKLWIGTENKGLFYLEDGIIKPFKFHDLIQQPISINALKINNGTLYVGTNTGLHSYSFSTGKEFHIGMNEGMVHNVIEDILVDSKGNFWFDSPVSPIYSYKEGEYTLYKDVKGFDSFDLSQIFETAHKDILFATMGDGLFVYKNGAFKQYNKKNSNILSNYIYFIVEDMNHQVWLGHKDGITKFNIESNKFEQYSEENNPLLKGINTKSFQLGADNKLWVGTERGLVRLDIERLKYETVFPEINYKGLIVNEKTFYKDREIELPYSDYEFEFNFQAIYFTNPKAVTYQYKLEGFDKKWNSVGYDKLEARYQSVIDGEYTFRLKVCLENSCSEKEIEVKVIVAKPFFKTNLGIALIVLCVLLTIAVIVYFILVGKITQNRKLDLKVQRRTLELSKMNRLVTVQNNKLQEVNEKVIKQKFDIEAKSKEIDSSIVYAKRIQNAFVMKDDYKLWSNYLKQSVIFEKPRDIVSGDFYWGFKSGDFLYVAVSDCTGHGVPGAMLSMLGIAFLNEIMISNSTISTNKLLDLLRSKMIRELVNKENEEVMKEGMDITLVRLNIKTKELQWSGANNPLYLIKNNKKGAKNIERIRITENDESILIELRPDKQPIGSYHLMTDFSRHDIQLEEGDSLFLSTDGYMDQFGGPHYKRFMSKRLKEMLLSIHNQPAEKQYGILERAFLDWKGDSFQIDDICIVGLKV